MQFFIERVGMDFGRPVYRVKQFMSFVTMKGDSVLVNSLIPASEATLWIFEQKNEDLYGLVDRLLSSLVTHRVRYTYRSILPSNTEQALDSVCWTIYDTSLGEPVSSRVLHCNTWEH